ncbi:MAG: ABC transporter [Propionibacteriales bacterium]|nr:ABC transporter [Propionibacteriales bacterium]
MTSVIEGADKLVIRGTEIGNRVKGLELAVAAARGRLDDAVLVPATEVVSKAAERLRLSADHTVVALGGATGSGKSSTFNALVGLDLASVGVRRPTTSWATACTWGTQGAGELLEWLGIPPRHQILRDSMLDTRREAEDPTELGGLVLLDLPDHDSTEVTHHLEVERLVRLADLLIWVLDPQKYADAAIHDRFLRPLAAHQGVMMVVLNHIDEVAEERRAGMIADLRRLLDADGLEGITLIATSAREGIGIDELRQAIVDRVADKAATRARIATNVAEVARAIQQVSGDAPPPTLTDADQAGLRAALAEAAGVPVIVDAVEKASLQRARRATGWPLTSWLSRFSRDRFKDLDLDGSGREFVAAAKATLPDTNQVQTARIDSAVRDLTDRLTGGLNRPWGAAARGAVLAGLPEVGQRLDRAVAATDLGVGKPPLWTQAVRLTQWLLLLAAVAGGLWAVAGVAAGLDQTKVGQVPVPVLLLVGGLALGALLAVVCRTLVERAARARAASAETRLRAAVDQVADDLVVGPLVAELDAYRVTTEGVRAALA